MSIVPFTSPAGLAFSGAPFVKVTNTGDEVFKDAYANIPYVIEPGGSAFVPGDAALLWFGDNGLFDIDARNRPREAERRRIRIKYGIYNDHDTWDERTPSVRVESLDGERLYTLIEDPDGTKAREAAGETEGSTSGDALADRIVFLERELKTLMGVLQSQQHACEAERLGDATVDGEDDGDGGDGDDLNPADAEDLTGDGDGDGEEDTSARPDGPLIPPFRQ